MSTAVQLAAVPPVVDPEDFHVFHGFRETSLCLFTDPEHNAALRVTGRLIFTMASEGDNDWPPEPEGNPRHRVD